MVRYQFFDRHGPKFKHSSYFWTSFWIKHISFAVLIACFSIFHSLLSLWFSFCMSQAFSGTTGPLWRFLHGLCSFSRCALLISSIACKRLLLCIWGHVLAQLWAWSRLRQFKPPFRLCNCFLLFVFSSFSYWLWAVLRSETCVHQYYEVFSLVWFLRGQFSLFSPLFPLLNRILYDLRTYRYRNHVGVDVHGAYEFEAFFPLFYIDKR